MKWLFLDFYIFEGYSDLENLPLVNIDWTFYPILFLWWLLSYSFLLDVPIFFFLITLFRVWFFLSVAYPTDTNLLIYPDSESWFIVRSQLGPSIYSGSSPRAGLQVVIQSTHLSKDCYLQLVSNPYRSEIQPPKYLDYRCMTLHLCHYTTALHHWWRERWTKSILQLFLKDVT